MGSSRLHRHCLIVDLPLVEGNNGCLRDAVCAGGWCVCVFLCVGGGSYTCTEPLCVGTVTNSLQNGFTDSVLVELKTGTQSNAIYFVCCKCGKNPSAVRNTRALSHAATSSVRVGGKRRSLAAGSVLANRVNPFTVMLHVLDMTENCANTLPQEKSPLSFVACV